MKGMLTVPSRFILLLFAIAIILSMSYYDDSYGYTDAPLLSREVKLPFNTSISTAIVVIAVAIFAFFVFRKRR